MPSEPIRRAAIPAAAILAAAIGLSMIEASQIHFSPINVDWVSAANNVRPWSSVFVGCFAYWLALCLLLPVVRLCAFEFRLDDERVWRNAVIHMALALVFAFCYLIGGQALRQIVLKDRPFVPHSIYLISHFYAYGFVIYWGMLGSLYAFTYFEQARSRAFVASRLEAFLTLAELQALRSRLNPHFLFNTLGAISALAMVGGREKVVEIVGRLSQLLRRSIDELGALEVPLGTEVDFLHDYLQIQQLRFEDRLTFVDEIRPDTLHALVPAMVLQPLVENAVEHGVGAASGRGKVSVAARRDRDVLHLEIRDTGPGFGSTHRQADPGHGIGLGSTRQRLEYMYGRNHLFQCSDLPDGGARVTLSIPFRVATTTGEG
jgi:signal transduction histidine kinase